MSVEISRLGTAASIVHHPSRELPPAVRSLGDVETGSTLGLPISLAARLVRDFLAGAAGPRWPVVPVLLVRWVGVGHLRASTRHFSTHHDMH